MSLRLLYRTTKGEWEDAMRETYRPIAEASTAAIREAAEIAKRDGRADIAAAGFSKRWQNALRVDVYPAGNKVSASAAAFIYHKIQYAGVFEDGATIKGSPYLWLPLAGTPKKVSRRKLTPERFTSDIGPLHFVKPPGGKPLLVTNLRLSRKKAAEARPKLTIGTLRKGKSGGGKNGILKSVPVFVGIRNVNIKKRFNITKIVEDVAGQIAAFYVKNFKPDR